MPEIEHYLSDAVVDQDATPVIVFLHGYGSNERDLAALADHIAPEQPWVSLRAPIELQPGAYAWAPITTPGFPDPTAIETATDELWEWIDTNLGAERLLIPVGFSQGGLMATQLLRTRPERLARIAVLAGFTLDAPQPADARLRDSQPSVFYARGLEDTVIAPAAVERTEAWLAEHTEIDGHRYPGLGHAIDERVLADLVAYLGAH